MIAEKEKQDEFMKTKLEIITILLSYYPRPSDDSEKSDAPRFLLNKFVDDDAKGGKKEGSRL